LDSILICDIELLEANLFVFAPEVLAGLTKAALDKVGDDNTPALVEQRAHNGKADP